MKVLRVLACIAVLVIATSVARVAGAQEQPPTPPPPPPKIEVNPSFPRIENIAGSNFTFEVALVYTGDSPKVFDLQATAPKGWEVYMTPQFEQNRRISSIRLEPTFGGGTKINLVANAPFFPLPDPGNYKINLKASSGNITGAADVTAVITAKYQLTVVSATERLNTTAVVGGDNFYSIKVQNLGTAAIEKINFSSTKPESWTIEFKPDKLDSLDAFSEKTVDINIKPGAKTIAGDYMITLSTSGTQATAQNIDVRVTVETRSVWGWVGVAIIAVVMAGLIGVFMRFSRR